MRPAAICLLTLSFSAALSVAAAQAQVPAAAFEGPIVTAPPEVGPPAVNVVAPSIPTAPAAPIDLTQPRETTTAEAVAAVEAPRAEALASAERAEVLAEADDDKVIELGGNAELATSAVQVGEAGGGLLRTNPALQRPNRRPMGLKFKF
jgi:hypothetical protein